MPKPSHREKLLTNGLQVVLERGFGGASVRDIVQAAGVPQGSFTNHFASKEAFGLEVLDLYCQHTQQTIRDTLRNESLSPRERLRAYIDANVRRIDRHGVQNGCLIGNYSIEVSEHSETIRQRIVEIFAHVERAIEQCLEAAVAAGELSPDADCAGLASFIVSSQQGAILRAKAQRSLAPIDRFTDLLFSVVLRSPGAA